MREELRRDHRADRVSAEVFRTGGAAAVAEEAGQRVVAARLKHAAEHVEITGHVCSSGYFAAGRSFACTCAETTPLFAATPLTLASFFGLRTSRPPLSLLPTTVSLLRMTGSRA